MSRPFAVLIVAALLSLACRGPGSAGSTEPLPIAAPDPVTAAPAADPEVVVVEVARAEPVPAPEPGPPRDDTLDDAALFLSGLPLPEGSALSEHAARADYQSYVARIDDVWARFEENTRGQLRGWSDEHLDDVPAGPVFYPFSGPDILNAVLLFPKGTEFTLIGLEPTGSFPQPGAEPWDDTLAGLDRLEHSVAPHLRRNFFITKAMLEDLDGAEQGVTGVLLFFLARTGHEMVGGRFIELTPAGDVVGLGEQEEIVPPSVKGVEIRFRLRGAPGADAVKTVRYFPGNVNDDFYTLNPGFAAHIERLGPLSTLLKAASYLLYFSEFDDIRSAILSRSLFIVNESSGLPFHYLDTEGWDVSLYGVYTDPIEHFEKRCQPDLKRALEERGLGELPFHFTYQYKIADHLVVARRAEAREITTPRYDGTTKVGESTSCSGDEVLVRRIGGP